ncbi:replication-relaxation family protein [Streptomyces krungchingensis]|uniref:replication-relaxation family protein n=1 Tax=Streptomyces krungchingensis TaxID=1565034 RepID=UPI003CF3412D
MELETLETARSAWGTAWTDGLAVAKDCAAVACEWPEFRTRRTPKTVSDPTEVRLRVGHALTVTETGLAFPQNARRHGDVYRPPDWIPEVYHPVGSGEAVIPDAVLFYRSCGGAGGVMLRAFAEAHRATMGPERLTAKLTAYARLHRYLLPLPVAQCRSLGQEPPQEEWRRHHPLFPRLLFVLDGTGPAGAETRISARCAAAGNLAPAAFLYDVPVLSGPPADVLEHGPSAPIWRPVQDPDRRVSRMRAHRPSAAAPRPSSQRDSSAAQGRPWHAEPGP